MEGFPTVDQIEAAIFAGDMQRIRELTDGLSEPERAPLRKALEKKTKELVTDLLRQSEGQPMPADPVRAEAVNRAIGKIKFIGSGKWFGVLCAAKLLLVAIGSRTQVEWSLLGLRRRWGTWEDHNRPVRERYGYHSIMALQARPVDWASDLLLQGFTIEADIAWDTEGPLTAGEDLLRARKVTPEVLIPAMSRAARRHGLSRLDWSVDLWRDVVLAALEARDEPTLASVSYGDELPHKFRDAANSGRIARGPLLDLALQRFAEIPKKHDANWWGQLIEALAPTSEEWSERPDAVLDLLGAPTTRAAGVGIDAAKKLLASGAVAPEMLVPALQPALGSEAIGVAKGAVDLLRACAKKEPSLLSEALTSALQGLSHPKPAVSGAVLSWLEGQSGWRDDPELMDEVALAASGMPEAIAVRLRALLPDEVNAESDAAPSTSSQGDSSTVLVLVRERLKTEADPAWRTFLSGCELALQGKSPLPEPPPRDEEAWREGPPFVVPQTPEETARLLLKAGALWSLSSALEALLAGMRLTLNAEDATLLGRMLQQLIPKGEPPPPEPWSWIGFWQCAGLRKGCDPFARRRFEANLAAINAGVTRLPLSVPTHASGYLDPLVLAERLAGMDEWHERDLLELSSALYRLAPGKRSREAAWLRIEPGVARMPTPVQASMTVALGPEDAVNAAGGRLVEWAAEKGFDPVNPKKVTALRLLCAAARARYPDTPAPFMQSAQRGSALRHLLSPTKSRLIDSLIAYGELFLPYSMPQEQERKSMFESMVESVRSRVGLTDDVMKRHNEWLAEWQNWATLPSVFPELASLHPWPAPGLAADSAFAFPAGIGALLSGFLKRRDKIWDPNTFVELLNEARRPDLPLRPLLPSLRALANDEKREIREAVLALLQAGHRDGRLFSDEVVAFLVGALSGKDARPRALMPTLVAAAALDEDFRDAASMAVEGLIASSAQGEGGPAAADRVALLEPLHAWRAAAGRGIEEPAARAVLEALAASKGKTRTRELAQLLLRLSTPPGRPPLPTSLTARDVRLALGLAET